MSLPSLAADQLHKALVEVGLAAGDGLLIHSALQFLGKPEDGQGMYLDVIEKLIGEEGTLAVPSFTFAFARGEAFDWRTSPSEGMGSFSEFVRKDQRAKRTSHPMQSIALIGKHAQKLSKMESPAAFDDGSAFDGMLDLDFKLLLLGADIQAASIVHYSEQRAAVPYRYWKEFTGNVWDQDGWQAGSYRMFVRDLALDPQLELSPIQKQLEEDGHWSSTEVNFGKISLCTLKNFVSACDQILAKDAWALVANRESVKN
jgi:aminoglycoside 3-N-acetyltransferase